MDIIQGTLARIAIAGVFVGALATGPVYADARASVNRGVALAREGRFVEAFAVVDEACLGQTIPECAHNRGVLLAQLERPEDASRILGELVRSGRAFPETRLAFGEVLLQLGRNREALRELDAAARLRPDDPFAHHNRGVALARLGQDAEAAAAFKVAASLRARIDGAASLRGGIDRAARTRW